MKRQILALVSVSLIAFGVQAQEQDYNKWSFDLGAGFNKPAVGLTSGFSTSSPSLWTAKAGVRYMMNNKFGVRLGGSYDNFKAGDDSKDFESNAWGVDLQGVANLARVLNFETWTSDLGLLAHAGVGIGQINSDYISKADNIGYIVAGLTPQLRLSNRVTLQGDVSTYFNSKQQRTFDTYSQTTRRAIQGVKLTGTIGLSIALGKHGQHADWYAEASRIDAIEDCVVALETNVSDLSSRLASVQNKMNDSNGNGVPDEIENYLNDNYATKADLSKIDVNSADVATDLIRKGYINVYFDFNSSKPQVSSTWATDFAVKYLRENSSAGVNVIGYADEVGGTNYNQSLSLKRADAVKKLLEDAGIDSSRITTQGGGEDTSVNKNSPRARQLARRATFQLK